MTCALIIAVATSLGTPTADAPEARRADPGAEARGEFAAGLDAFAAGRYDVAREHFALAAALVPQWGLAQLHWGLAEEALDPMSTTALGCFEKAAALAPDNPRAHYQLGLAYERRKRWADAARELELTLSLRPTFVEARFHLANVLSGDGKPNEALRVLREVITDDPRHNGAWAALADLCEQLGRVEEAEQAALSLVRLNPHAAYPYYRLGEFYERIGQTRKARQAFARAESIDPRPKRQMRDLR